MNKHRFVVGSIGIDLHYPRKLFCSGCLGNESEKLEFVRVSERLTVEEIAPTSNRLTDHNGQRCHIKRAHERYLFMDADADHRRRAENNTAVNSKSAVPDGKHLTYTVILVEGSHNVVKSRADNAEDHRKKEEIKQIVVINSFHVSAKTGVEKRRDHARNDNKAVPSHLKPEKRKRYGIKDKFTYSKVWKCYFYHNFLLIYQKDRPPTDRKGRQSCPSEAPP